MLGEIIHHCHGTEQDCTLLTEGWFTPYGCVNDARVAQGRTQTMKENSMVVFLYAIRRCLVYGPLSLLLPSNLS